MTISYNWLSEYLPKTIEPESLSHILTSIGLEVESLEKFESVKGGLSGLIAGEVLTCEKHPQADKLSLTTVNIGGEKILNIVCGAPNVAAGQKVIVAPVGCTIYPTNGEPLTLKKAKIRGEESEGMICAEDEIGLGESHAGITVLDQSILPGTLIKDIYNPYEDFVFEIGLTPNRMDAMSHLGVARDVCAYLSFHEQSTYEVKNPCLVSLENDETITNISISIENQQACMRYCGVSIHNVKVNESPVWLKQKLQSIGLKPINNIVDITNFILHETGQPLHAFDASKIVGEKIIIKSLKEGTVFTTLDEKERKLNSEDLMICNESEPMCIAGVYGGFESGVSNNTSNIFLESACFNPGHIRKTSMKHGLRTDAAVRFEKGVDISNTLLVLKRAAALVKEICGGRITSDFIDVYPSIKEKTIIEFEFAYLKKLSGKLYNPADIKNILTALGFEITHETNDQITLKVPFSKPDISIQADIVEEIMRIDGLDNVEIPAAISIVPSKDKTGIKSLINEKLANYLIGQGLNEMFTNSITNSSFYSEETLQTSVKMINSLTKELDIMRPGLLQSGLQVLSHNINRKNTDLRFFELGKTYHIAEDSKYVEKNHLAIFITGNMVNQGWKFTEQPADFFYLKGIVENIFLASGIRKIKFTESSSTYFSYCSNAISGKLEVAQIGAVSDKLLKQFDIKQPVYFADINMDVVIRLNEKAIQYKEISKFPAVKRDLALVVDKKVSYSQIQDVALTSSINQLKTIDLFDVYENDKLGNNKKSMAVSFTFLDEHKTMTDQEIDGFMKKLVSGFEKNIQAEIRK